MLCRAFTQYNIYETSQSAITVQIDMLHPSHTRRVPLHHWDEVKNCTAWIGSNVHCQGIFFLNFLGKPHVLKVLLSVPSSHSDIM